MRGSIKKIIESLKNINKYSIRQKAAAICGILAAVCALTAIITVVITFRIEKTSEDKMVNLRPVLEEIPESVEETAAAAGESQELLTNPYNELFAQNEDMVAWLVVDDTIIDYPVMQTMDDESYYLYKDFYGNDDKSGCLILDTDSTLESQEGVTTNLIIHGHNMKAGTMFGSLDEYEDEDYYNEHKYMELYTKGEIRCYEVIAVFRSQVFYASQDVFKYYKFFEADTQEEFDDFYDNIKSMSIYDTGVTAELGDNFLTLSTCAYHVEEGRFVVVAKEIDSSLYLFTNYQW